MPPVQCVRHRGIITGINPLRAEITTSGACEACHAKGYCSLGQTSIREITRLKEPEGWVPVLGQEVFIEMHTRMGFKALWYAMGLPSIILGVLVAVSALLHLPDWLLGSVASVSYTHLTLPTISSVLFSVVAVSLKKKTP